MKTFEKEHEELMDTVKSSRGVIPQTVETFGSIWKKPSERPDIGQVVVLLAKHSMEWRKFTFTMGCNWNFFGYRAWCYLSDFQKFLPEFAK